jgi:hypothetical protein
MAALKLDWDLLVDPLEDLIREKLAELKAELTGELAPKVTKLAVLSSDFLQRKVAGDARADKSLKLIQAVAEGIGANLAAKKAKEFVEFLFQVLQILATVLIGAVK